MVPPFSSIDVAAHQRSLEIIHESICNGELFQIIIFINSYTYFSFDLPPLNFFPYISHYYLYIIK